jgi:hypothetical protein
MSDSILVSCTKKKCGMKLTIPVKIISGRKNDIIYVSRCPNCHKLYKTFYDIRDIDTLVKLITPIFTCCDLCGTDNSDSWDFYEKKYAGHSDRRRIIIYCGNCGLTRVKVASDEIFDRLTAALLANREI